MESNVLSSIPGIEFYPLVSLILFLTFWTGLIVWYFRADKNRLASIAHQPIDDLRTESFDIHHQN
jgi:cytochrome c oxidase cbb3-type subunit 4